MGTPDSNERVPTSNGSMSVGELEARCSVVEPGIVVLREVPNNTGETYEVMLRRSLELGADFEKFVLVVDLTEATERPKGRYLELIRSCFDGPKPPLHLATSQPGKPFLRAVVAFVLARISKYTSAHQSYDSAVAAARQVLAQASSGPNDRALNH